MIIQNYRVPTYVNEINRASQSRFKLKMAPFYTRTNLKYNEEL